MVTRNVVSRLRKLGYDITVVDNSHTVVAPITAHGIPHLPLGGGLGEAETYEHYRRIKADWLLCLYDSFALQNFMQYAAQDREFRIIGHVPIDHDAIYPPVKAFLDASTVILPYADYAHRLMKEAGFTPPRLHAPIPHGVDTKIMRPLEESRESLVAHLNAMSDPVAPNGPAFRPGDLIVGIIKRNQDLRGWIPEQCFPPDTPVWCNGQLTPIADVHVGDTVYASGGTHVAVKRVMSRQYKGPLAVIKAAGMPKLRATPQHPILVYPRGEVSKWRALNCHRRDARKRGVGTKADATFDVKPKWVNVGDVKPGDYLAMPRPTQEWAQKDIPLASYRKNTWKNKPSNVPLDDEAADFLGWFMAEGTATPNATGHIQFALGPDEGPIADTLAKYAEDALDSSVQVYEKSASDPAGRGVVVQFDNVPMGRFLRDQFNHGATRKRLPWWVITSPTRFLRTFLTAYARGDGHYYGTKQGVKISTASKDAAVGTSLALSRLGVLGKVYHEPPRKDKMYRGRVVRDSGHYDVMVQGDGVEQLGGKALGAGSHTQTHHIVLEDRILVRVREVSQEAYEGPVHNLETESHTYTAPLLLSHNCEVFAQLCQSEPDLPLRLYLHTQMRQQYGHDLAGITALLGIADRVRYVKQYEEANFIPHETMARIYNACDVGSATTSTEGFSVPVLEWAACGKPVVGANNTTVTELLAWAPDLLVKNAGTYWAHNSCRYYHFDKGDALRALRAAVNHDPKDWQKRGVAFAAKYDYDKLVAEKWAPFMEELNATMVDRCLRLPQQDGSWDKDKQPVEVPA